MSIQWAILHSTKFTLCDVLTGDWRVLMCVCLSVSPLPLLPFSVCDVLALNCCIILSCEFKLSTISAVVHFYLIIHCWFYRVDSTSNFENLSKQFLNRTLASENPDPHFICCCCWLSQLFDIFMFEITVTFASHANNSNVFVNFLLLIHLMNSR